MTCLTSINYTMKADVYKPTVEQDATGAVKKTYTYEKTLDCLARTVTTTSVSRGNTTDMSINQYINYLTSIIKLRTSISIPTDRKIVMVRNDDGIIWTEVQDPTSSGGFNGSTIFEIRGSTPIFNFDGSIIEYEVILTRQENQKLS